MRTFLHRLARDYPNTLLFGNLFFWAFFVSGCLPGMIPPINTGNTTTEEAPGVKENSDHQAPVFNINVYANPDVRTSGRDMITGGAAQVEEPGLGVAPLEEPAAAPPPTSLRLNELAPLDKGGDPTMVGRLYGGLTLEEFNRLQCDSVATEERLEPVSPVWEGCRPYWKEKPSPLQGD